MMLPNINLLYLGATVLVLMDLSYRASTQFEAGQHAEVHDGRLVSAPEAEHGPDLHPHPHRVSETLPRGHVTAQKAYERLTVRCDGDEL